MTVTIGRASLAFVMRYEIHGVIASLRTVRAQPRFRSHVISVGYFSLLQINTI